MKPVNTVACVNCLDGCFLFLLCPGYEASKDKVFEEPLLADPDEPPPVMMAEPAPMAATVTLEGADPAIYPESGQEATHTGGILIHWSGDHSLELSKASMKVIHNYINGILIALQHCVLEY